jgi:hypothetical protein
MKKPAGEDGLIVIVSKWLAIRPDWMGQEHVALMVIDILVDTPWGGTPDCAQF